MEAIFELQRNTSNQIIWQKGQKEKIVELYVKEKKSIRQIIQLFHGLHYNTIKRILTEFNIPLRTRAQSHYQDNRIEDIFAQIDTEEKAYWLGFLAADGCVSGNYIIISLQKKDEEHLLKFRNFLQATSIQITYPTHILENGSIGEYCRFSIGCKKMAEDLKRQGIVENKTTILQPPKIDEKFYYDWIRGYFDGDGGLSYSEQTNRWQSYANSTQCVLDWIVQVMQLNTKPFHQKHRNIFDNVWRIHFNGRINVYNFWNKLYKNDTATIFLQRKHDLFLKLKHTFEE